MITTIVLAALLTRIDAPSGAPTDSDSGRRLLALSKADHTMAIVDPVTLKVMARLPVGPDPHEVIASTDGTRAYVSNMGFGGQGHHEINVIDLVEKKVLPNIDTGPLTAPHGLDFAGGKLWFTAQGAKAVGRVDPATGRVEWIMGTRPGLDPHDPRLPRRGADLHDQRQVRHGQHPGLRPGPAAQTAGGCRSSRCQVQVRVRGPAAGLLREWGHPRNGSRPSSRPGRAWRGST